MQVCEELICHIIDDVISPEELDIWKSPLLGVKGAITEGRDRIIKDVLWSEVDAPWERLLSHLPTILFVPDDSIVYRLIGHGNKLRYSSQLLGDCKSGPIHCDEFEEMVYFDDDIKEVEIQLSVLIYLSDGFDGGITRFYPDADNYSKFVDVEPREGRVVVFDRRLRHAAMPIASTIHPADHTKDVVKFSVGYGRSDVSIDPQIHKDPHIEPLPAWNQIEHQLRMSMKGDPYNVSVDYNMQATHSGILCLSL